jgi:hypothetical protein
MHEESKHAKHILSQSDVHPIRRIINLGYYPNLIDFDPGPMPNNIYDRGILNNFRYASRITSVCII